MGGASAVSERRRILLVDDVELIRTLTEALLRSATYEVDSVADGASAIAALEDRTYDLVLMDVMMPDLDGHETAAEIRRRESETTTRGNVRLAAISSRSGPAARLRSVEVGMTTHIARPIAPHELLRQIERVFCQAVAVPEPDPWQKQHYEEWASRLGVARVDSFLVSLQDQFRTLRKLLVDDARKDETHRLAHDVASTGGMLGFHEVTRCCRALLEATDTTTEIDARFKLVHALECAAASLDRHLASVNQAAAAA